MQQNATKELQQAKRKEIAAGRKKASNFYVYRVL
jgi:hypothetical protein